MLNITEMFYAYIEFQWGSQLRLFFKITVPWDIRGRRLRQLCSFKTSYSEDKIIHSCCLDNLTSLILLVLLPSYIDRIFLTIWILHMSMRITFNYLSMALQPFVGPWPIFSFLFFHIAGRTPLKGDQPVSRPLPAYTGHHKYRINTHRHPCFNWVLNPQSQHSSERR
jgi:hypothetical protein